MTAEDTPSSGETSVIARTLLLKVKGSGDSERLTRGQMHCIHLPGVMAKYLQYLAKLNPKGEELLARIRARQLTFNAFHKRINESAAANAIAWEVLAEFMGLQDLTPEYNKAIEAIVSEMDFAAKAEQAGTVFSEAVHDLLESGLYYLEGIRGCNDTPHVDNAKKLGFVDDDHVYLFGNLCIAEANALRQKVTGTTIKYSSGAIYDQLAASGMLVVQKGKPTTVIKVDGTSYRVLKLVKGEFDYDGAIENDAEHASSPVWTEEDGALLN